MKLSRLFCTVALAAIYTSEAAAQVTVPLPGAPGSPPAQTSNAEAAPPAPMPAQAEPPADDTAPGPAMGPHGRPDINPYERDIDMTVPLLFRDRTLGDLSVRLTADDRFLLDSSQFLRLIAPLLSEQALAGISANLEQTPTFSGELLDHSGISVRYDPNALAAVVMEIEPAIRAVERLFEVPQLMEEATLLDPAPFSAYLNMNAVSSYLWQNGRLTDPAITLSGAMRVHQFVLEGDGQFGQEGGVFGNTAIQSSYQFSRNYVRLVYDEPDVFRRWSAGDLEVEIRGQQSFARIGGLGVTRQRRRFNEYRTGVLQLDRQFVLQRDATVRILRNGTLFRELRLEPGSYDFSALPLLSGSNDVQIEIRDDAGGVQRVAFETYLDPIDLEPGDYEYALQVGKLNESFGPSPTYDGPLALSGFFRVAPVNAPAFGVGVQASEHVQALTGQSQIILPNAARLLLDGGASHSKAVGAGFAFGVSYEQLIDRAGLVDSFSIRADYLSRRFSGLGNPDADNSLSWSLNGQYTRAFSEQFSVSALASVQGSREDDTTYRLGAVTSYRISPQWSIRGGVDYTRLPGRFANRGGLGFNVSLVFQPSFRRRAEARYESSTEQVQLSYAQAGLNQINTVGYGAAVSRDPQSTSAVAYADYIGNRFDASLSHAATGADFGSIGDRNISTLRVGSTLAFAGGAFGIGRRVNDSFAILVPHRTLDGRSVVAGQSLTNHEYLGRSGALGGALNNFLTSYVAQSVHYDVEDPPIGYDTGPGVYRVRPPYRSGYAIVVGTDAFATATGTLLLENGQPVALASGRFVAIDGEDEPRPFFTNSAGRFALDGLHAGRKYRVELYGNEGEAGRTFEFTVPADTTGLVDLGRMRSGASR